MTPPERLAAVDARVERAAEARGLLQRLARGLRPSLSGPAISAASEAALAALETLAEREGERRLVLLRLAAQRRFSAELRALRLAIAEAGGVGEEDGEWAALEREALGRIAAAVENERLLAAEADGDRAREAFALLRFEQQHHGDEQPEGVLEIIDAALRWGERVVPALVPKATPPWLVPSDEVQVETSDEIDAGSFGSVHRATWRGQRVVAKILLSSESSTRTSLEREADVWWGLQHPNVIQLFGASHVGPSPLFVCEEATGGNFVDRFQPENGGLRGVWRLFQQVATGIAYLHSKFVVHGDLKCNNLLVGGDGTAKICDFGFSFIRMQSAGLSTKAQADAVRWKAPECLLPDYNGQLTPSQNPRFASDVYSLGICLIEVFANAPPYDFLDDDTITEMVLEGVLPNRPPDMTDDRAWNLVTDMCAYEWAERPRISEVIRRMKELADEEGLQDRVDALDKHAPSTDALTVDLSMKP